jgi:hypothetical protein
MAKKGILLMCFGSKSYGKFAFNMAHSIRHYSGIDIHLICDKVSIEGIDISIFNSLSVYEFEKDSAGRIDVGLSKIKLFDRSPFDKTLYLDVDGVMLKSPDDLFDIFEGTPIYTQLMDFGRREDNISYSLWASNETVWDHFKLSEHDVLPTVQTSLIYFEKTAGHFFEKLNENYENRLRPEQYLEMWGRSKHHPDELYYGVTMAQLGILPEAFDPVFFPNKMETVSNILNGYWVLSMFGGNNVKPYGLNLYDKLMKAIMDKKGKNHYYKAHKLYHNKFINQK